MKKKAWFTRIALSIAVLALAASFLALPVPIARAAVTVDLYLIPNYTDVNVGETFNITIQVHANLEPAVNGDIFLDFNTTCLDCVSITSNFTSWSSVTGNEFDNTYGYVNYSAGIDSTPYPNETFDIATVTFLAETGGTTDITFHFLDIKRETVVINDTNYPVLDDTFGTSVNIKTPGGPSPGGGGGGGGEVVPICLPCDANCDDFYDARDISKESRIMLGFDAITEGADCIQDGEIDALDMTGIKRVILGLRYCVSGDANCDGGFDAQDVTKVGRIILGLDAPTPGADCNGDGKIDVQDLTAIKRIALGV